MQPSLQIYKIIPGVQYLVSSGVIVRARKALARIMDGPDPKPDSDYFDMRNKKLFDLMLCADGTRDATIRIWKTQTGAVAASCYAPDDGSRCLTLSADGRCVASASPTAPSEFETRRCFRAIQISGPKKVKTK